MSGYYFVEICTYKRENIFGQILKEKIELNEFGKITDVCVTNISQHFPNALVDSYSVMPNNIHLIVILDDNRDTMIPHPLHK